MIQFQIDADDTIKDIEERLGSLKRKAPSVLASAVNMTAKDARKMLASEAQKVYAIKGGGFNKAMTIANAKQSSPLATIKAKGSPIELFKFKTSPATFKTGDSRPKSAKGRVKAHGGMKDLLVDGRWAFVTTFKSGHKTMVQRTTKDRLPIKTLMSPSIPKMLGDEDEVYGVVEPHIQELLDKNITIAIRKAIAREAAKAAKGGNA